MNSLQTRAHDGDSSAMIGLLRDKPLWSRSHTIFSIPTLTSAMTRTQGTRGGGPYYSIFSRPSGILSIGIREEGNKLDVLSTVVMPDLHTARGALANAHTTHTSACVRKHESATRPLLTRATSPSSC